MANRKQRQFLRLNIILLFSSWNLSLAFLLKQGGHLMDPHGRNYGFCLSSRNIWRLYDYINSNEQREDRSTVAWISSNNLGGMTGISGENIRIDFASSGSGSSFVCMTGDSGVGKSVLLARAAELLSGGKTSPKVLGLNPSSAKGLEAVVEIEFHLVGQHLSLVRNILLQQNAPPSIFENEQSELLRLRCRRSISLHQPVRSASKSSARQYRLKSLCEINGCQVTLQLLSSVVTPLVAVVDGAKAAAALSRPEIRTLILDMSVSPTARLQVSQKKKAYREAKRERQKAQAILDNRVLPKGFSLNNENDAKLLSHWIDEFTAFKSRVMQLCKSFDGLEHRDSGALATCSKLATTEWNDSSSTDPRFFSSTIYELLSELRDGLRSLDNQLSAANNALNALTLLSSNESVLSALERSRKFVNEASYGQALEDERIVNSAEKCHDLLNSLEEAVTRCARYIEDDPRGLIQTVEAERALCQINVEQIDEILTGWGTLARKHGVSPSSLPSCHQMLLDEQRGGNEASLLLPRLVENEERLFSDYVDACRHLSKLRQDAAEELSVSVNSRLPALGMNPIFDVSIVSGRYDNPDKLVALGADDVEFLFGEGGSPADPESASADVHAIASAGEKARLLLAIECAIPGSVAAACMKGNLDNEIFNRPLPVLVLYDEIDAHVGGHATTALAMMLSEQAKNNQIVAITHSPAVAALADNHIRVQRFSSTDNRRSVCVEVKTLADRERTQELARMASGSLATEEAEAFANALLRDGASMRNLTGLER